MALWGLLNVVAFLVARETGSLFFEASFCLGPPEVFAELRPLEHEGISVGVNVSRKPVGVATDTAGTSDVGPVQHTAFSELVLEVASGAVARALGVLNEVSQFVPFRLDLAALRAGSLRVTDLGSATVELALGAG